MDFILLKLMNGVTMGFIYAMLAFGLSIILGMLNIPNFAHGAFFALGAYIAFTIVTVTNSLMLGLLTAGISIALLGVVLERFFLLRLYDKDPDLRYQLLLLFGLAIGLQEVIILIWMLMIYPI